MSKKHAEEGGGHGGRWIVTYSDMITLLMTLFIVIVTFGSKEQDKGSKKLDSVVGGMGGTGVAGPTGQGIGRDAVMVRMSPLSRSVYSGSQTPPTYSDPGDQPAGTALKALQEQPLGQLSDNFAFRVPFDFVFDSAGKVSPSGATFLRTVAGAVRRLPFNIQVRVTNKSRAAGAAKVVQYLFAEAGLYPGRLGVAISQASAGATENELLLVLLRNP
jgi:chemotaxis protein MotB